MTISEQWPKWITPKHFAAELVKILRRSIDASTGIGKVRLLFLLITLGYLFNWSGNIKVPYNEFRNFFQSGHAFTDNPFIQAKIAHPFGPVDCTMDTTGHFEKLAFRFVPFLIAHILRLNQDGLACLQILLGVVFPLLVWKVLFEATNSPSLAVGGAVLLNGLYLGCSFFCDRIFFDSFAYFFLLCSMLRTPRWVSFGFMMCAAFTDERAILASCLMPAWRLLVERPDPTLERVTKEALWQFGFLFIYAILRLAIGAATGLETGHRGIGFEVFRLNLPNIGLLIWSVFEGGWIFVILAGFKLWNFGSAAQRFVGCIAFVCLVCIVIAGLLVGDCIRSHQYAFPLLLTAIAIAGRQPSKISPWIIGMAIVLTLLTPITIYPGMRHIGDHTLYNLYFLRPGYVDLFGV